MNRHGEYFTKHKHNLFLSAVWRLWFDWIYINIFTWVIKRRRSRGSSVSIVSDYGLDDRAIGVGSPAEAKDFSSSLSEQTGSGAHPFSCTMGTGGPFPGIKRVRGVKLTTHPHLVPKSTMSRSYTSSFPSSPCWWRQYVRLKRRYTPTKLHCAASQKVIIFGHKLCSQTLKVVLDSVEWIHLAHVTDSVTQYTTLTVHNSDFIN
jgi:hypothetical protein